MNKKKIIHIVSSLNVGGAERFVIDLSQDIKETNNCVEILSFGDVNNTLWKVAEDAGIKVNTISKSSSISGQLTLFKLLSGVDVIHLHTPRVIKTLSIVLKLIGKKKLIYTRHGAADLSSSEWQSRHAKFRKYVDYMTFVSQEAMDVFTRVYLWEDIKKEVVDNGVKIPQLDQRQKSNILKIGAVGRFVELKNQISLLKALKKLPNDIQKNVEVHLFGDGECEHQLKEFVNQSELEKHVTFHGMVEDRNFIYNSFDLLCVTSETEGLSLAIMEAMAFALPVLATDVGGNSKLVKHDVTGWLFDYNDVEAMVEKITWLMSNRDVMLNFGAEGREYIKNTFSINSASKKYMSIYNCGM